MPLDDARGAGDPGLGELLRSSGIRSLLGAPMWSRNRLTGVVLVASRGPRRFAGEQLRLLELVADRVGTIINEADLQRRAFAAYWRFARPGEPVVKLDTARADAVEIRGRWYVILTAGKRRVAVFRVRTDDKLKRLVRLPRELLSSDED